MTAREEVYGARHVLRPGSVRALVRAAQARTARGPRHTPRSVEERKMLLHMAAVAANDRVDTGRLERVGPREYRLHLSTASRQAKPHADGYALRS